MTASARRRKNGLVLPLGRPGTRQPTWGSRLLGKERTPRHGLSSAPHLGHPPRGHRPSSPHAPTQPFSRRWCRGEAKSWDRQEAGGGKSAVGGRQRGRGGGFKGPRAACGARRAPPALAKVSSGSASHGVRVPRGLLPKHRTSCETCKGTPWDTPNSPSSGAHLKPDFPGDELAAPGEREPRPGSL